MNRNKLYTLFLIACVTGYLWLAYSYFHIRSVPHDAEVCLFKYIVKIPCPSCGSTRSVLSLLNGDFWGALNWNPFGLILFLILAILPFWVLYDIFGRKESFYRFYVSMERFLKKRSIAVPAILLALANWIWNIYKGV